MLPQQPQFYYLSVTQKILLIIVATGMDLKYSFNGFSKSYNAPSKQKQCV